MAHLAGNRLRHKWIITQREGVRDAAKFRQRMRHYGCVDKVLKKHIAFCSYGRHDAGSLKDYLVDPAKPPIKTLAQEISWKRGRQIDKTRCCLLTALDIAEALKFMHKSTTLHGDLKPHNILLVSDNKDEKLFRAKISDFGLSVHMTAGQTSVSISQGTEAYLPKEVFQTFKVTEASDIYALGLLIWEIFYGIFWFIVWDAEKRRKNVRSPEQMDGYKPSCSPSCPEGLQSIIHDCLSSSPENRPSAGDVVARLINVIEQHPAQAY